MPAFSRNTENDQENGGRVEEETEMLTVFRSCSWSLGTKHSLGKHSYNYTRKGDAL